MLDYIISHDATENYFIVGDVHGNNMQLINNYKYYLKCKKTVPNLKLIFLGDYLDRGAHEPECIAALQLIQSSSEYGKNIFCLFGNHEVFKYEHTLTEKDPSKEFENRLEYYKRLGLKFYYAYINMAKALIISHSGIKPESFTEKGLKQHCEYMIKSIDNIQQYQLYIDPSKALDNVTKQIHDSLFYPFVDNWTEDVIAAMKEFDNNGFLQVVGHYHLAGGLTYRGSIFSIYRIRNIIKQNIKCIALDTSDTPMITSALLIDDMWNIAYIQFSVDLQI